MFGELDRPPLRERELRAALARTPFWTSLRLLASTGSTNDVAAAAARAGEPEGLVVVAEHQTGGRGRLGRVWESPPRAGLTLSMLLRPAGVPRERLPWLPLLVGVAVARAVEERTGVAVRLKWPNDLLVGDRKAGGLLAEAVAPDAVVVGVGLNVLTRRDELPGELATSLALEADRPVDRAPLLLAVLRAVAPDYGAWVARAGSPVELGPAYRAVCDTLGREVRVSLPGGEALTGVAEAVDDEGRLVVAGRPVSAGDVVHVRGAQGSAGRA